jgi:hypothetical protein
MNAWRKRFSFALLTAAFFAGCGGGGGGGDSPLPGQVPIESTASFPLLSAYKANIANGSTTTFTSTISVINPATGALVTCHANGSSSSSPAATAATFEGQPALSATGTVTVNVVASADCAALTTEESMTSYFDSNYVGLGSSIADGGYSVFQAPPVIPATVQVGDAALIGTQDIYTDSTKSTSIGTEVISFIVEADTASTAIVNVMTKDIDATGILMSTSEARWRITEAGVFTPISVDVLLAGGDRMHIQYD